MKNPIYLIALGPGIKLTANAPPDRDIFSPPLRLIKTAHYGLNLFSSVIEITAGVYLDFPLKVRLHVRFDSAFSQSISSPKWKMRVAKIVKKIFGMKAWSQTA